MRCKFQRLGEFKVKSIYIDGTGLGAVYAGNRHWSIGLVYGAGPQSTVSNVAVMFVWLIMSALPVLRRIVSHRRVLLLY